MLDQRNALQECRRLDAEGNIELSIKTLTDVIALAPTAVLYFERGWRFEEIGEFGLAKSDYTRAIQAERLSKYLTARGLLSSDRLSDHDSGLQDFQDALAIDPKNAVVHIHLSLTNLLLGRLEIALKFARSAAEFAPDDYATHSCFGQGLLAAEQPIDAVREFRISASLNPDIANSWGMLAHALLIAKQFADAKTCICEGNRTSSLTNFHDYICETSIGNA